MEKPNHSYRHRDISYTKRHEQKRRIRYRYCCRHQYIERAETASDATAISSADTTDGQAPETFAAYCEKWLDMNSVRLKTSTIAKYRCMMENHIISSLGTCIAAELDGGMLADFYDELLYQKNLAAKTVRDILTLVRKIIIDASIENGVSVTDLQFTYPRIEKKEMRVLSMKEQKQFTQYLVKDIDIYKLAVLSSLITGLRIGEICGLQWKHISTDSKLMTVKNTVQRIRNPEAGSGRKTMLHIGTPKTPSSARVIPIPDRLAELFSMFQTDEPDHFIMTGSSSPMDPRRLQRRLKKYTADLGMQGVHFHTLRHTFATRYIELGCDMKTLSEILGHSSISITMNRYVHPSIDFKRENIRKLEDAGFLSTPAGSPGPDDHMAVAP